MNKSASHTAASSVGSVRAPAPPGGGSVSSPTLPLLPWSLPAADGDAQLMLKPPCEVMLTGN